MGKGTIIVKILPESENKTRRKKFDFGFSGLFTSVIRAQFGHSKNRN